MFIIINMGIKDLNKLLKKECPDCFFTLPISELAGKRIAIDAYLLMYQRMSIARKIIINNTDLQFGLPDKYQIRQYWLNDIAKFLIQWTYENITPIMVFDGKCPDDKEGIRNERKEKKRIAKAKIDFYYEQLNIALPECRGGLIEGISKEMKNLVSISDEDRDMLLTVLNALGIPCLHGVDEGERLCASLCIENKVAAVFTTDTDTLVYGAPLMITNKTSKRGMECVRLDKVLQGLKLSQEEFVDLCIMCGCDFNGGKNMPNVASINAFKLIQKFHNIDNLPRNYDVSILNHYNSRKLFTYVSSQQLTSISCDLFINKAALENARDCLEMAGISDLIPPAIRSYNNLTSISEEPISLLKDFVIPRYVPPIDYLSKSSPSRPVLNIISGPSCVIPNLTEFLSKC